MKAIPKVTQNLVCGLRQSPGIEIVEVGGSIEAIQPPTSTTQSRELSGKPSNQILSHLGYMLSLLLLFALQLNGSEQILIEKATRIILNSNASEFVDFSELEETLVPYYLDQAITASKLEEIKQVISNYFADRECPFVVVQIPEQEIIDGVIEFDVTLGILDQVRVVGNCWSSSERLKSYIHLCPGQIIQESVLIENLDMINRNPFRRVDVIYSPGENIGTTDITLAVKDRRPFRSYIGTDNTGISTTGLERSFVGFNYGNLFGLDHIFSFQYTTSSDFKKFQAYTAQYTAPLSWGHILNIYGGYSSVKAHLTFSPTRNSGQSAQADLRYSIPLTPGRLLAQEIIWGGDFKRTNNTVEFLEEGERFGKNVNLTQVMIAYSGDIQKNRFKVDYLAEIFWSPGKWISDQTNADYASLRPGAKNHWVYGKAMFKYLQRILGKWSISLLAEGQLSNQNLLPSEQMGLGGYNTVRGYRERQLSVDNGLLLSGEFRTPGWAFFSRCKRDALQFLCFADYGYGKNHTAISGEPTHQYLLGAGPGLRYTFDPYLTIRFDWGIKLHRKNSFEGGFSQTHFSVIASY